MISGSCLCGNVKYLIEGQIESAESLRLKQVEIEVGRSSQSTLLGRKEITTESLYLSPTLSNGQFEAISYLCKKSKQLTLLEKHGQFSTAAR